MKTLPTDKYKGLQNQGSTCYLNSALQILFMSKEFRENIESMQENENEVLIQLKGLFENLQGESERISTRGVTTSLKITNVNEQQDAVEWLRNIISNVGSSAAKVFQVTVQKQFICLNKDHDSTLEEEFSIIPLSVGPEKNEIYHVNEMLKSFFAPVKLDEDNRMYCDVCRGKTITAIRRTIKQCPPILGLQIKRFQFDPTCMTWVKNRCPISVPSIIDLEGCRYSIYGVINHSGNLKSGHYNAFIKPPGDDNWFFFDDSRVEVGEGNLSQLSSTEKAYLIMYKKTPDWVQCETCSEKATKSCLNCGTTYCETHLKPHMVAKRLKKHKLMDPVENLEDYICKKHERPLQFFCRDDQTCVCQFCTEGDHRGHNTVPVEEEYEEKKSQLKKTQREVQEIIQDREKMHKKFKATHALRETQKNQLKADIEDKFCLEKILPRLLEGMEEEQRAAERQAEGLIKDLQQEITEHQRRNSELEKISHTEDHLHLLQIYPTLCSPPHTRNWADVMGPHLSEEAVRRTASENEILFYKKLKTFLETLSKKAQIIAEIKQCGLHAVDVTLDPDSAHPSLILSADGKQVRHGDKRQNLPDNPERFDECICVLGKEGFSSGRFYYEVEVRGKTEWDLGVARESINRKGKITVSSQNGYWTVSLRNGKYKACAGPPVLLSLSMKPQKVGVFVDYEEGLVSFYDVENSSHIYSFTGQSLSEKLYPFFSTGLNDGGKNSAPLIISPVTNTLTS